MIFIHFKAIPDPIRMNGKKMNEIIQNKNKKFQHKMEKNMYISTTWNETENLSLNQWRAIEFFYCESERAICHKAWKKCIQRHTCTNESNWVYDRNTLSENEIVQIKVNKTGMEAM